MKLPASVDGYNDGLAGALPPSLGELGLLTLLRLRFNAITSLPTELGALTGLTSLDLGSNQLTGVPTEFRTVNPSIFCRFSGNPGFSCANVGAGTSCCTSTNCVDVETCYSG